MNTNVEEMAQRCPGARVVTTGWLDNYELVFRTHADIQPKAGSRCHGVIWDIGIDDLFALDCLEGYPNYYIRFNVLANTAQGMLPVMVYQMADDRYIAPPSINYYTMLQQGYRTHNLPMHQLISTDDEPSVLDFPH